MSDQLESQMCGKNLMKSHVSTCSVQVSDFVGSVRSQMRVKNCMKSHVSTCSVQVSTFVGSVRKPDVW